MKLSQYRVDDVLQPISKEWTDNEHNRFIDAIRKYRRQWEKVAEAVGTRSLEGVRHRFKKMENKEEIFPNIAYNQPYIFWTADEQNKFVTALKQHGKNYAKITEAVGSKTHS